MHWGFTKLPDRRDSNRDGAKPDEMKWSRSRRVGVEGVRYFGVRRTNKKSTRVTESLSGSKTEDPSTFMIVSKGFLIVKSSFLPSNVMFESTSFKSWFFSSSFERSNNSPQPVWLALARAWLSHGTYSQPRYSSSFQ